MQKLKGAIKKNIIAGLLVTVPVALTYIILEFVITRIDEMMVPVVSKLINEKAMENFNGYFVPGMGFLLLILFVFLIGLIATNIFGKKIFKFGELVLHKIPLVRVIYITIKKVGLLSSKMSNRMMYRMMAIIKETFLIFSTERQKRFPIEIKIKPVKKVIIPSKYPWDVPA